VASQPGEEKKRLKFLPDLFTDSVVVEDKPKIAA
jgi:hypothetical protein